MAKQSQNITRLKKIYESLDEEKKTYADKMIVELDFMERDLDELRKTIKKDGATINSINTKGYEVKTEHPAQKSYNTMIKNYNSTIKALIELIPKDADGCDELEAYLGGSK